MLENYEINVKGNKIQSKYYFAPINPGLAINGNPTPQFINFQKTRSGKNIGINYVGNISVSSELVTNKNTLYINDKMRGYENLVFEIEKNGTLSGAQIGSVKSKQTPLRKWKNKSQDQYINFVQNEISSLSLSEIDTIIKDFQNGIIILKKLGFKVIQIHAAHGYLLNNFLSTTFNVRNDIYGKEPTLIIKKIIDGISNELDDIILDLRISLFENEILTNLNSERKEFLDSIYAIEGLDMISISNGIYNYSKHLIYPNERYKNGFMTDILFDYIINKKEKVWNISGNIKDLRLINNNDKHISFSIGRALIADDRFVEKSFNNKFSSIKHCNNSNHCHYYSRGKESIECSVNPKLY